MTCLDLHPRTGTDPIRVASRLHVEDGRITRVRVMFDLGTLLQAGERRR